MNRVDMEECALFFETRLGPDARDIVRIPLYPPVFPCIPLSDQMPLRVFVQVPVRSVGCNAASSLSACGLTKV